MGQTSSRLAARTMAPFSRSNGRERERPGKRRTRRGAAAWLAHFEAKSRLHLSLVRNYSQGNCGREGGRLKLLIAFHSWFFISDAASSSSLQDLVAVHSPDAANQHSHAQQLSLSPLFKENLISCRWISKLYINSSPPFFHLYS